MKLLVRSSIPMSRIPPDEFANATIVRRTWPGDERSRLNSSVLLSCRLSMVIRFIYSAIFSEAKSLSTLQSRPGPLPGSLP